MRLGCVVMASGDGARFGGDKLRADFLGRPVLDRLLDALPPELETVVVARRPEIQALAEARGFPCLLHALPDKSDTIRLGIGRMAGACGCLFCVGDQPLLTRATVARVMAAFEREPEHIVRTAFQGRFGNPVMFPRSLFGELAALNVGETGGAVIRRHPALVCSAEAGFAEELEDIDTREALARLEEYARKRGGEEGTCG